MMLVLSGLALAAGTFSHNSVVGSRAYLQDQQAFYVAETGWQRGRQALVAGTWTAAASPGNTYTESFGPGQYRVTLVDNGDSTYTITSEGYVPSQAAAVASRRVVESAVPANVNLSLSATASASSAQSGHPASDANDGSSTSFWRANTQGSGEWLQMDYGASQTLDQIVIEENANIAGLSAVQSSPDGSTWTAVPGLTVTSSGSGDNQTWTADFTATVARYFRVTFTSTAGNQRVSVEESESYGGSGLGEGAFTTSW
jgi:hypothetical protein